MKINCLIIDDEPLALEVLESYIEKLDDLHLVGKCNNALSALEILRRDQVDLLFLDIQMPKLTGIEFLKNLANPPQVIFTTAYRDYALEGYELNVLDYLLKPYSFERFFKAVSKYQHHSHSNGSENHENLDPLEEIYLKSDKKMVKVRLEDIIYVESLKDYIRVKTKDQEVISHQKISYMEERLPEQQFLRVHRSFIIALDKIDAFSATVVELSGNTIPIGRNYKNHTLDLLKQKAL
jgi:DNA-binding LytR/AlgR family response regulator